MKFSFLISKTSNSFLQNSFSIQLKRNGTRDSFEIWRRLNPTSGGTKLQAIIKAISTYMHTFIIIFILYVFHFTANNYFKIHCSPDLGALQHDEFCQEVRKQPIFDALCCLLHNLTRATFLSATLTSPQLNAYTTARLIYQTLVPLASTCKEYTSLSQRAAVHVLS